MELLNALLALLGLTCSVICFFMWISSKIPRLRGQLEHHSLKFSFGIFGGLAAFILAVLLSPTSSTNTSEQVKAGPTTQMQSDANETLEPTPPTKEVNEASNLTPVTTEVTINFVSDPEGATLYVDDKMEGETPTSIDATAGTTLNYRLIADDTFAEYDLYKPFSGSLEVSENNAISVWIERTTSEEQEAQKVSYQQKQQAAAIRESEERLRDNDLQYLLGPACENLVKNVLKAPSTAKFPGIFSSGESFWVDYDAGKAYFTSYVDAQNSFGAMLRNDFSCSYDASSDTVSLDYFE